MQRHRAPFQQQLEVNDGSDADTSNPVGDLLAHPISRRQLVQRAGGTIVASSALASLFAACGGSGSQGQTAAAGKGNIGGDLSIYAWEGYYNREAARPFVDKYNVSVKTSSISSSEEILTTLKAGGTSRFSLCTPATAIGTQLAPAGLLQPLDLERLPTTKQYIPRIAKATKHFEVDGKVYVAPYVWGLSACVYDSKVLPKGPQSWDDFKSPKYAKRLAMLDSTLDNFATWAPSLGYEPFNMTTEELEDVTNFLIEFKNTQVRTFTSNFDDAADQLVRGEIDGIGTMAWIYLVTLAQEKGGKSITWNLPSGVGGVIWIDGWAIPSEAPNVDTAYAFMDYMIGEKPQSIVAPATYSETVNSKAAPQIPHSSRPTEKFSNAMLEERAVLFETPTGENGKASYEDYVRAWARVQAA